MKVFEMEEGKYKILGAHWGPLNETIFSCDESGLITVWDVETGKVKHVIDDHHAAVKHMHFTRDRGAFLSSSSDHTARLFDSRTYECIKVCLNAYSWQFFSFALCSPCRAFMSVVCGCVLFCFLLLY
jgi:WD40 repeat protein